MVAAREEPGGVRSEEAHERDRAAHGDRRSTERGAAAAEQLRGHVPYAQVEVRRLDLADLASVQEFAGTVDGSLDLLVNNAGVMALDRGRTVDGFETQLGVNHLGHFALTAHLLPALPGTTGAERLSDGDILVMCSASALDHLPAGIGAVLAWAPRELAAQQPDVLLDRLMLDTDVGSALLARYHAPTSYPPTNGDLMEEENR